MGGEREQRDARSAHAGAVWSLMEPRIGAIKGYFLKISGDSEMHSQDKDPILIEGQGRWRMHAQEPGEMWIKYRQANVDEKKTVSDL